MNSIWKFIIAMVLIAIVPLGIRTFFQYNNALKELEEQVNDELEVRADNLASRIDAWMDTNLRMLRQNALHEDIISMKRERQIPILKAMRKEYGQWALTVFTVNAKGQGVARSDEQSLKNYDDRAWFQSAMKGSYGVSVQIGRSVARPACAFAVPISDADKNRVGVITITSLIEKVSDLVASRKVGETGYFYILNDDGRVVAHYHKRYADGVADFNRHPAMAQLGHDAKKRIIFTDDQSNKKTIAFVKRSKYHWISVVQQDYDEAFAVVINMKRKLIVFTIVMLVIFAVVMVWLTKYLRKVRTQSATARKQSQIFLAILAAMLVVVVAPWAIEEYADYRLMRWQVENEQDQWAAIQLEASSNKIDDWIEMNAKMLSQNALLRDIMSVNPKKQNPILRSITKEYPWYWLAFTLRNGRQVARSDELPLLDLSDRAYVSKAQSGQLFSSDVVVSRTHNKPVWTLAVPVFGDDQKVHGVLGAASFLSDLTSYVSNMKVDSVGYAYLLTDTGKLVAHQKKAFTEAILDFSQTAPFQSLAQTNQNKINYINPLSGEKIQSYAQRGQRGWVVVIERVEEQVNAVIRELQRKACIAMIIVVVSALVIAFVLSLAVVKGQSSK